MFCSNCGTEVPEGHKFCGKCGADFSSGAVPAPRGGNVTEEDEDEDSLDLSWLYKIIFYAAIAGVLFYLNPSDRKVEVEVARTMIDVASDKAGKMLGSDISWLIDSDSFTDKQALSAARKFGSITVKDYYLFKIGSFTPVHKKEGAPVAIGICGTSFSWIPFFKPWID